MTLFSNTNCTKHIKTYTPALEFPWTTIDLGVAHSPWFWRIRSGEAMAPLVSPRQSFYQPANASVRTIHSAAFREAFRSRYRGKRSVTEVREARRDELVR